MATAMQTDIGTRTVADIMQHRVTTVQADATLAEVARVLWNGQISGAPVVDTNGTPIGFVSASDIVRYKAFGRHYQPPGGAGLAARDLESLAAAVGRAGHNPRGRGATARDLMTPATFTVRSTTSVADLAHFLTRASSHHALVIDDGVLVGIVSAYDIVQDVAEQATRTAATRQAAQEASL